MLVKNATIHKIPRNITTAKAHVSHISAHPSAILCSLRMNAFNPSSTCSSSDGPG